MVDCTFNQIGIPTLSELSPMLKDGKWADHVVPLAIAHILNRNILLVTCSPEAISGKAYQWIVGD